MLSIIIPIYNQHDMTSECIEAIRRNTSGIAYELILVDNGSTPAYQPPFSGFNETRILRNESNEGFPKAVNRGIREATEETICLLNNDVIVTPGWASTLMSWLDEYDIIGPMTNYAAGIQQHSAAYYDDTDSLNQAAETIRDEYAGASTDTRFIIGFCMVFKRAVYIKIGEFDESLWPCSGEEIDFCFRARVAGYRIGVAHDCYLHHEGSRTFAEMDRTGLCSYQEIVERNDKHLAAKWGPDVWQQQVCRGIDKDGIRLNLGSGHFPIPGFTNVDLFPHVNPDLVADAKRLPFEPGTVDEIYAGHILEHFDWVDGQAALKHWFELLRPGGVLSVCVPDFDILARDHIADPSAGNMRKMNDAYIYSYMQESPHKYMYNGPLLKVVMIDAGFINVEKMPRNHLYYASPLEWQIGYSGRKP